MVQTSENPYYGGDPDLQPGSQTILASDNPYYGGDPDLEPGSHTIQTSDNPYYGLDVDAALGDSNAKKKGKKKKNRGDATNVTVTENPYYDEG